MYKLIRPLLFKKDAEAAHNLALSFLKMVGAEPFSSAITALTQATSPALEQKVFGLTFKNPVGAAAGYDKPGKSLKGLQAIGFGHVEVGTVSRFAQEGNPKPRLFRLLEDQALINRFGFNSLGSEALAKQISSYKNLQIPIGISIGKTKVVPLEQAHEDYLGSFKTLYDQAGYFAINVSSPNTPNLRQLAEKSYLIEIISALLEYRAKQKTYKPILIKVVVDFSLEAIDEILEVCRDLKLDGIICSNTTVSREGLKTQINEAGGLSGLPIQQKSTEYIRHIRKHSPTLPIIGVGGIFSAKDAYEKIKAGASLVQVYTGLVYEGPFLVKKVNQGLVKLLEADGFKNISEAVGVDPV